MTKRLLAFIFGILVYLVFLLTVLYGIGFVGNVFVPKGIDDGIDSPPVIALTINLSLLVLFGVQHSLMARPAFKKRWVRLVPQPVERSTYVLCASLSLLLLFWQWRPLTAYVWNFPSGLKNVALTSLFWIGWFDVVLSTFLISHFDLFGLRQVYYHLRDIDYVPVAFEQPTFYKFVRHPLMLAFLIAFWATPQMSVGHLFFAVSMTSYIFIGIAFEERDLSKAYGETYERYRRQVPMLIPMPRRK